MVKNNFPNQNHWVGCAERSEAHQSRAMRLLSSAASYALNREIIYAQILKTSMCRGRKIALLVIACVAFEKEAAAAEWVVEGALEQQLQYNDNISLNPIRKDSVAGYLLAPRLQASRKTEVLEIAFDGQGDIRRYDDSRWDCDNYNLGLSNVYRTKRSVFSVRGGYGNNCSYSQQITDTGLLLPNRSQVENYNLAPSWTWQWTPRDQLILDASYSKTSYSNLLNANSLSFSGNDTYTVNLGMNHEWSRRLSLNGKLHFSNIQYAGFGTSTQNVFGFQLGADYLINRFWTVSASGGPLWVDGAGQNLTGISSGQNSSLSLGSAANINLNYKGQLTQFSGRYSNAVNPSAIGQTLQTHFVFVNYSYQLARHIFWDFTGNYTLSQSIGGDQSIGSQFDRSYFSVATGIAWEFAKNWGLRGSYAYSRQDFQQDSNVQNFNVGTGDSNVVTLLLSYSWDGFRMSR